MDNNIPKDYDKKKESHVKQHGLDSKHTARSNEQSDKIKLDKNDKKPNENNKKFDGNKENSMHVLQDKERSTQWKIKPTTIPTDDPLLNCLVVLTRIKYKPYSPEVLTAGLPLVDNKLTPELFVRAAKRAELSSQIIKRSLDEISELVLPVVLLLKDKKACILISKEKKKVCKIIAPETGDGEEKIPISALKELYTGYAIFIKPTYKFEERTKTFGIDKEKHGWFWSVIYKIIPFYGEVLIASFLVNIFALVTPLFTMNVYDRVVPNNAMETLLILAIGVGTVYLFDFLIKTLRSYFIDMAGKKADILLSSAIFEQMLGIKMEARPESVGSFANNISQFDSFRDFITSATMTTIIDLPFVIIFVLVIQYVGGPLFWIPVIAIPIVLTSSMILQNPMNNLVKKSYLYSSQKQAMLIESLIGIETIKSVGSESPMQRKWEHVGGMASKYIIKSKIYSTLATNISALAQQMAGVFIVIIGVHLIIENEITMGALIACNMLNSRALAPLGQLAGLITRYHQAITSFKAVDGIMNMPVERPPGKTPLHRKKLIGAIEFKEVSFKYPKQDGMALYKVSFAIQPGEKVGIIGRVGSGKTTLEKLIMGLYEPVDGNILLDRTESKQLDPTVIRKNIGYVPQDIMLFYGSVKENIVVGAPFVDDDAILRAANIASVTDFVARHPKGFDLEIGERGETLSGGQRQSIAIARALLLDPPILILDEPTNSMDTKSEETFKEKLVKTCKDKTVIIVTHKGNLLSVVNRVIVMDEGQIIADGPKDTVLKALMEGKIQPAQSRHFQ